MAREIQKAPESNRASNLLTEEENKSVFNLIGKRCATLSTTVVQVFKCGSGQNSWQKLCVGIICFVKDNQKKSYFVRVFDLMIKNMVWEQEIYNQFKYFVPRNHFHSFEADSFVVGLNFADQQEANHFRQMIEGKLRAKQQRKTERRATTVKREAVNNRVNALQPVNYNTQSPPAVPAPTPTISPSPSANDLKKKDSKPGKKKVKLSKEDIGTPSDFRHVGHVGWDPKGGFDVNNIDPQWRKLFDTIGVTEKQLEDAETSKFIYDFVESHGGIEKATKELENSDVAPPPPARSAPPPPPPSRQGPPRGQAPPIPQFLDRELSMKGPPARSAPPPPPSTRAGPPPPPQVSRGPPPPPQMTAPPPPPFNAPAPPPPPPVPVAGVPLPPPPPPGVPKSAPVAGVAKGGLLDQIHQGRQLNKVEPQQKEVSGDGRDDLLSAIRLGAKLKTVSQSDPRSSVVEDDQLEGMAGALAKALAMRSAHIQVSDNDDEDEEEDDFDEDDWSD